MFRVLTLVLPILAAVAIAWVTSGRSGHSTRIWNREIEYGPVVNDSNGKSKSRKKDNCPICLMEYEEQFGERHEIELPCRHKLCSKCLEVLVRNPTLSCPLCREMVPGTFVRALKRDL